MQDGSNAFGSRWDSFSLKGVGTKRVAAVALRLLDVQAATIQV